ncbi:TRAP transporter small permease subunit [Pararhodobacter marinus]|uniref:TRAP transporter small permease subunit n=1 Tax=Pararhodobacter marinus TaxID=2184063 RepID=UPI003517C81D
MQKLHSFLYRLSRLSVWIFGAGYLAIALATTADVLMRWLFSISTPAVYEVSGYIFAVATTWGFAFVLFERAHVRIDVVYQALGPRLRALADLLALLALTLFVAVLTWRAWLTLDETLLFDSRARTALQTPLWIPQSLWLAGLAYFLLCLVFLSTYVLLLILRGRSAEVGTIAGIPHVAQHGGTAPGAAATRGGSAP